MKKVLYYFLNCGNIYYKYLFLILDLVEQTEAVLGGSDDTICTYSMGYVKRQALYSCLTCNKSENNPIGICLGCSLRCHSTCELIELYTKRKFRCDCGLKGGLECQLDPLKIEGNDDNKYNQNFSGLYCSCKRPYPDPEDEIPDEMIQCIVCEDWLHTRHINKKVPTTDAYSEMVCGECMQNKSVLEYYTGLAVDIIETADESNNELSLNSPLVEEDNISETSAKRIKLSDDACVKPTRLETYKTGTATFWKEGWRKNLCNCSNCIAAYKEQQIEFLLDDEDTVHSYEEMGKKNAKPKINDYEQGMAALSTLPRVSQIDAITGYNKMKDKLFEFLQVYK